jgi:acyl-[acyl-carrier-protein]-phospholipid O-acyltransferase/long-chain-fatty-acid--[acyl-carrier-protein] ligase
MKSTPRSCRQRRKCLLKPAALRHNPAIPPYPTQDAPPMETSLWKNRFFLIYLFIAFLNAFTDLGHKIVIQNTLFKYYEGQELIIYTAVIQALILLPFVMVFTPAGFLADKYPKHRVIQIAAFAALPITAMITMCYYMSWFWPAFWLTFLLALQSAFYSPAKYSYIRELVGKNKLAPANAAVQTVTIVAILGGTVAFSVVFESLFNKNAQSLGEIVFSVKYAGYFLIIATLCEFLLSLTLPPRTETDRAMRFDFNAYIRTKSLQLNLRRALAHRGIWLSIIGLSVFWAVNQVILANFGAHLKHAVGETDTVVANGLMALGGIGIILGAGFAGKVSKNYIETGIIPLGALGMCIALALLPGLHDRWSLGFLFMVYGFFGGMFIVPLNALIQYLAGDGESGIIIAANNFVQTMFMLAFLIVAIVLAQAGVNHIGMFYLMAALTLIGTVYTVIQLPQSFVRYLVSGMLNWRYRVEVVGMKNIPSTGGVLLLGNHVSWLDWAILQIASPRPIRFVMSRLYYEKWYLRWFLNMFKVIPISSGASRNALEAVQTALQAEEVVALFPEGHISHNGHLSVFKSGYERAVQDTGAAIVPFYLRGLWGSRFSYVSSKYRESSRDGALRKVTVGFGKPLPAQTEAVALKQAVLETSIHTWQEYVGELEPLAHSFLRTAKALGNRLAVMEASQSLTYSRLLAGAILFCGKLAPAMQGQQNIGILLPPSAGCVLANLAVLMRGKTLVNLNYTAPAATVAASMERAEIQTVLTSSLFLKKLEGRGIDLTPLQEKARFVLLEDLRTEISGGQRIWAYIQARFLPLWLLRAMYFHPARPGDTAAILFSSGSEGVPKGVMLSHANIMGNLKQIATLINPLEEEVILNALPTFHAFGLTVTTLLPLIEGIPMVCQADPTDAQAVGQLVAKYRVTIIAATSTFLRIYTRSRKVHPLMFQSLRLVVAGAERLSEDVRKGFKEKFYKEIYEGYGATETTPVACVNVPDILLSHSGEVQTGNKHGTVGLALPGARVKIVDPETLQELPTGEAGLILIGGTQIMQGYLKDPDKTASVLVEQDGIRWYKSGDKGKLDEDGFLVILDRYSRFAKLGGEMVSLGAVEAEISKLLGDNPDLEILATAIADEAKGEKIVLLVAGAMQPDEIRALVLKSGMNPLTQPKEYLKVEAIPKLGSGKADFSAAKKLALEKVGGT